MYVTIGKKFSGNTGQDVIHPLIASAYQENVLALGSVVGILP